ncbi:MAG: TGS domain-containing protein [Rhodoglobus sp.]
MATDVVTTGYDLARQKLAKDELAHAVVVAQVVAEAGADVVAVAATLLCPTLAHGVTIPRLRYLYRDVDEPLGQLSSAPGATPGHEIALVAGSVAKLRGLVLAPDTPPGDRRGAVVAIAADPRALIVEVARHLVEARGWGEVARLPGAKGGPFDQDAAGNLEVFGPIARVLGLEPVRAELQDLSFRALHPAIYEEMRGLVDERAPQREEVTAQVVGVIEDDLRNAGLPARVSGRSKELFSIYEKMQLKGRDFSVLYDLVGIRVIVGDVRTCYAVLGLLHARWKPVPGRFKDYIFTPKFDLYQSLHTTVIGPGGRPVEIQVRTEEMDQHARSQHWRYKHEGPKVDPDMARLESLLRRGTTADVVGLDAVDVTPEQDEVFPVTPVGKPVRLPAGATALDFAYAVHSRVGHGAVAAEVNGRGVPLDYRLTSGDVVRVHKSDDPGARPEEAWLEFAAAPRTREQIRRRLLTPMSSGSAAPAAIVAQDPPSQDVSEELVDAARSFAHAVHAGQLDKAGQPYFGHVSRVAALVEEAGGSRAQVVVALLHDVVEDDRGTVEDLQELDLPIELQRSVVALTQYPGEAREHYIDRIVANPTAVLVKRCDIQDNLSPARLAQLENRTRRRLEAKYAADLDQIDEETAAGLGPTLDEGMR